MKIDDRVIDIMKRVCDTEGRFWPGEISGRIGVTSDTVKAALKREGIANFSPERDGWWVLTEKGRNITGRSS